MPVCGEVERLSLEELAQLETPPATRTFHPIPHSRVMDMVLTTLDMLRLEVRDMDLAVARNGDRFFATLDLALDITDGVTLAAGVRNSVDKSFALSFCAGSRVFCCSNLSFESEIVVTRKHTTNVEDDFHGQIIKAAMELRKYRDLSAERISQLQSAHLTEEQADALLLRAFEKGLAGARMLPKLIAEWREPTYDEFQSRNRWSMYNCFTHLMKPRFQALPYQAADETMRFQEFLAA